MKGGVVKGTEKVVLMYIISFMLVVKRLNLHLDKNSIYHIFEYTCFGWLPISRSHGNQYLNILQATSIPFYSPPLRLMFVMKVFFSSF